MKKKYFSKFHHGIMFHRFHRDGTKPDGKGSVSQSQFVKIIKLVGVKNILTPNEWIKKLKNNSFIKSDLCLTFDDGLKSQINYALPLLEKYKLKAFWFVFSSVLNNKIDENELYNNLIYKNYKSTIIFQKKFFEYCKIKKNLFQSKKFKDYYRESKKLYRILSLDDIKYRFIRNIFFSRKELIKKMNSFLKIKKKDYLKAQKLWVNKSDIKKLNNLGHMVGMHSHSHDLNFKGLSRNKQIREYKLNYEELYKITKIKPISMSHPLNSYNKETLKILKKLKIVCGFRSNLVADKKINKSNLEIARNDPAYIFKYI